MRMVNKFGEGRVFVAGGTSFHTARSGSSSEGYSPVDSAHVHRYALFTIFLPISNVVAVRQVARFVHFYLPSSLLNIKLDYQGLNSGIQDSVGFFMVLCPSSLY
jgi:hypothetical protein